MYIEVVYNDESEAHLAPEPTLAPWEIHSAPTLLPESQEPISVPIVWEGYSCGLFSVTGVITDFCGPVSENGIVPWDVEWFTFEIEKADGTPAIIAGVHTTAFIFGSKPEIGMEITAYVAYDLPIFVNDLLIYVATAIVTGFSPENRFIVCCDFSGEKFSFVIEDAMEYIHAVKERLYDNWRYCRSAQRLLQWPAERGLFPHFAVIYSTTEDELPVAHTIFAFNDKDFFWFFGEHQETPQEVMLNFTNYVFPAYTFETVDLPLFINGEKVNSASPILVDGIIMVPLREAMQASIIIREFTFLSDDGNLGFIGGGGGSENSHWQIGCASVGFIGSRRAPMSLPPIIVGGIVYVPYLAICGVPFAGVWRFEDRIEVFHADSFPQGIWQEFCRETGTALVSDEELASFPIIFNGVEVASGGAFRRLDNILIPIAAIAKGLGEHYIVRDEQVYFRNSHGEERQIWAYTTEDGEIYIELRWVWELRAIIYNEQILIKSRETIIIAHPIKSSFIWQTSCIFVTLWGVIIQKTEKRCIWHKK
ncbi:MAG: hypothetical protein FWF78_06910 [Defluviitaleaceae bacterium]|nr:hypothetical protein [Defluviitaleaceae bacterium]